MGFEFTVKETSAALAMLGRAGLSGEQAGKAMRIQFKQLLCKHESDYTLVFLDETWHRQCNECEMLEPASDLEALACEYKMRVHG